MSGTSGSTRASGLSDLDALRAAWSARWEEALAIWSPFTKLAPPRFCVTGGDEKREGLTQSFAMIRFADHAVVISLRQVAERGLEAFPREILAHEIGHHVLAPADLRDNARLLARVRAGLPTRERFAGFVANLYTDLLINDRLQRSAGLRLSDVYERLRSPTQDTLWQVYMRIYEVLWSLPAGTLVAGELTEEQNVDAALGARLVRVYGRDWLRGAGRFAMLCLTYLLGIPDEKHLRWVDWSDTLDAGAGEALPDGLATLDDGELEGAIHPVDDPELTGLAPMGGEGRTEVGGRKNAYRDPARYLDLMKSLGVKIDEGEVVARYYRELAVPHLIRFPVKLEKPATDPHPEGLDVWDTGSPLSNVDWMQSLIRSPQIIPGVTTWERTYGDDVGSDPKKTPVDLYLGVDCSGSMNNPKLSLSYPVLAGAIITLSALRAGARAMACLSGEPGRYTQTEGFVRDERALLRLLTGYLGTGYSFGVLRLKETFVEAPPRPVHVLIVTDSDLFMMLDQVPDGWGIAARTLEIAGGGGTVVLHMGGPGGWAPHIERLRVQGWTVHLVASHEDLVAFARAFSRQHYERSAA